MRILLFITACLLACPALGNEFVAVGRVEQVTLQPNGSSKCPPVCPTNSKNTNSRSICVSNDCGCGEAEIAIDRILIGVPKSRILIHYRLGEWCKPGFPLANPMVLIRLDNGGNPEWSPLYRLHSGSYGFEPKHFTRIGPVNVSTLKVTHGLVSLRALEKRLGH